GVPSGASGGCGWLLSGRLLIGRLRTGRLMIGREVCRLKGGRERSGRASGGTAGVSSGGVASSTSMPRTGSHSLAIVSPDANGGPDVGESQCFIIALRHPHSHRLRGMNLSRQIAWRYLRRPTDRLVSAVGFVSVLGLVIGVMALVISMALMTGY